MRYLQTLLIAAAIVPPLSVRLSAQEPAVPAADEELAAHLAAVEDETPGLTEDERPAFSVLRDDVRATTLEQRRRAAAAWRERRTNEYATAPGGDASTFSLYYDLMRNPDRYRGKPVHFEGYLRMLDRWASDGVESEPLYEAVITTGSGYQDPIRVICAEVPDGLPQGDELAEPVSVLGNFFKLQAQPEGDRYQLMPLLVAESLEWAGPREADSVRLDPALWAEVQDKTELREYDFYYFLLKHAGDVPYEAQQAAAREHLAERRAKFAADPRNARREFSTFADVFLHPEAWRGETVTLRGHVRRIVPYQADENQYGVDQLYEIWMFPDDAATNPVVVISRDIPDEMPTPGERDPVDNVTVTGYFFKLHVYTAGDAKRVAPMILAQRIEWSPVNVPGLPAWMKWGAFTLLAVLAAAMVAWFWTSSARDRQFRARRAAADAQAGEVTDFSAIETAETPPPTPKND